MWQIPWIYHWLYYCFLKVIFFKKRYLAYLSLHSGGMKPVVMYSDTFHLTVIA